MKWIVAVRYLHKEPYGKNTCDSYDISVLPERYISELDDIDMINYMVNAIEHLTPISKWVVCEEDVVTRIKRAVDKSNKLLQIKSL